MDCKVTGSLMHYAVFLIFLGVRWSPVFPAPTSSASSNCTDIKNIMGLAEIIKHEADELQHLFIRYYGNMGDSVPPEVPDSQISNLSIAEKLQNICIKNKLFKLHIALAENYQKDLLFDQKDMLKAFRKIKNRLSNLTDMIQKSTGAEICTLTTPAPLNLSHNGSYKKKVYVQGVTVRLKEWSEKVLEVVMEAQTACGQK